MHDFRPNRWLDRYAVFTAFATLVLICIGGLVTSHEAGLAVPDWPTSFGYNMFLLPLSKWMPGTGVFYEHSHRLVASLVGMLTIVLAIWLWFKEDRRWMRWLGVAAVLAVVFQGVLGGLRVRWLKDEIGIFHGAIAQLFFVLMCAIALFRSGWWRKIREFQISDSRFQILRLVFVVITALIFVQLLIGATMRHQHAGLAIPDFPTAYGKVWPDTDADSIARYNQTRTDATGVKPITAFQVVLQMVHRITALAILLGVTAAGWMAWRRLGTGHALFRVACVWLALIIVQVFLGAYTVWSNKAADVATAHVAVGALSLATGAILTLVGYASSCSAGFQPVVSPISNRHAVANASFLANALQVRNLRYGRLETCATPDETT